ncbi:hypothetical protein Tco_1360662 [Tanacetum coccineum]
MTITGTKLVFRNKLDENGVVSRNNVMLVAQGYNQQEYIDYVPWSLRDANRAVPVNETLHEQTDDELTEKELKQVEADDQAIQTILLGLPGDIYAAVDSCETAQEIWFTSTDGESIESYYHRFSKLMNDFKRNKHFPEKIASNLKFLNNLQPEWTRHVTIVHQTKDLHTADYNHLYDFLKYNQKEVDDLRAERLAKTHDPLALTANSNNPFNYSVFHQDQPSPNPTTAMNIALVLMANAFKLNYSTPTNNNQRISSNPRNSTKCQASGCSECNVGNQNRLIVVLGIANQNLNGNGNVVAARAEGNAIRNNADLDEIKEVNGNCILMANLQKASTSKEQYTELLEPIPEPYQVQQNDSNVISDVSSVEQSGGTVDQHPATVEEIRAYFESLYNNLAIKVEKVNSVNRRMKETNADLTTELARYKNQEKCFEISQEKYDKLERCYQKSVYQEKCLTKKINALHLSSGKQITTLNEEILNLNEQLSKEKSSVSSLLEEKKKLKSDFKIHEDELLDKQIQLENKIKELDNILVKTGQSIQMMHMLSPKPDSFYHTEQKMALGYQNPFYLKQAQQKQQSLYDGKILLEKHDPLDVYDS